MKTLTQEKVIELVLEISRIDDFLEEGVIKEFKDFEYIYREQDLDYDKLSAQIIIYDDSFGEYKFERSGFKSFSCGEYKGDIWYDWKLV